jgi:LysR family transcriptional regulator, transcriptional activator of nhaA
MAIAARRLNYQHLLYFWAVVRAGSLAKACDELHLSAPTVSTQLRTFEERIGQKLLTKQGRRLVTTEVGRLVFNYAEEIFSLGSDLLSTLAHRPTDRPKRLVVGIDDVVPKEIAQRLLEGVMELPQPTQIICREGTLEHLLAALRLHEIDVILSDSPVTPSLNDRAYNHLLGACGESWMASPTMAKSLRAGFPKSLHGAPLLLPTADTAIRRSLDQWLDKHGVEPLIVGEFEDSALMREFASAGKGVAPVPDVLIQQLQKYAGLSLVGNARKVQAQFYAISMERKVKNPATQAILDTAGEIFPS